MIAERVRADEVVVGDRVCKTKRGEYQTVIGIEAGEKARYINLGLEVNGQRTGMCRIRPRHETKLWVLRN